QRPADRQRTEGVRMTAPSMQKLFDKIPPFSLEAEMAMLGCVIYEPKILDEMQAEVAGPEVFYSEAHAAVYRAMARRFDRTHGTLDLVLLNEELKDQGLLDD